MAQEFSAEKQDFNVIKEKIIKTNQLLLMYNDKNEKLSKVTQAYKNLKLNWETSSQEVNRLKLANEQLSEVIERLQLKHQEAENALKEMKSDYAKVEERYHQNLIKSQEVMTELELKVKQCVCDKDLLTLSPSTKKTKDDKIKELKSLCINLKDAEHKLRIENNSLIRKNKLLETRRTNRADKINLHKELADVREKLQQAESALREQNNLQDNIAWLKQAHEKEVQQLKMENSRLLLDRIRLNNLEKECSSLKEQIVVITSKNVDQRDFSNQTEQVEQQNISMKAPDICKVCQKGFSEEIDEVEPTEEVLDDEFLDSEILFSDIFREMILPRKVLSPMNFSPISTDGPMETYLTQSLTSNVSDDSLEEGFISKKPLPNIIITPPTPSVDCNSSVKMQFPVLTDLPAIEESMEITENCHKTENCPDEDESLISSCIENALFSNGDSPPLNNEPTNKSLTENGPTISSSTPEILVPTQGNSPEEESMPSSVALMNLEPQHSISASSDTMEKTATEPELLPKRLPQRRNRRKFWLPWSFSTFLAPRPKPIIKVLTKKYQQSCSPRKDTILDALRTLKQNNIHFTISSEPIVKPQENYSFPNTFIEKTQCCVQSCAETNRFMKLRTLPHQKEPELLGFFSAKDEEKPLPPPPSSSMTSTTIRESSKKDDCDLRYLADKIVSGLQELSNFKRKKTAIMDYRRRKRIMASEFNSETEPELERLFRKSGTVLGRNRKLLAAAREQTFQSNGESVIESDYSDAMVDSGLVTATSKTDNSMSVCSPNEEESLPSPVARANFKNATFEQSEVKEAFASNCKKTRISDIPFCSDVNNVQLGNNHLDNIIGDSLDLYKTPFCPPMMSPLASSAKSTPEEDTKKVHAATPETPLKETLLTKPSFFQKITFDDVQSCAVIDSFGKADVDVDVADSLEKGFTDASALSVIEHKENTKSTDEADLKKSLQHTTSEIQQILRGATPPEKKDRRLSQRDLFGDLSDSDDDCVDVKVAPKPANRKQPPKKGRSLKARMLKQVKGLVYAYGNKVCDNSSCATTKPLGINENIPQKINVLQNIQISKSQIVDLLSNSVRKTTAKNGSRKKLKVAAATTDLLSEVIQGMTRTGPAQVQPAKIPHFATTKPKSDCNAAVSDVKSIGEAAKDPFWDCPRSPDILEVPDRLPRLIPTQKPLPIAPSKVVILMDKLMVFCSDETVLDEIIEEFAFQDVDYMARIALEKVAKDTQDKVDVSFPPSPPLTSTQRILLGFLIKLDKSTHPGVLDRFLAQAEMAVYNRHTRELSAVQPITRLYTAVCKMRLDVNRMRRFICECFYFADDFAVPVLFFVLTMWPDVLPKNSEVSRFPLAKVIVQVCYMKTCNVPGYNLLPLRDLLHKHFEYPTERWSCDEVFQEILVEYIRNPSVRLSDFTVLLFLKNKPAKWAYQKIKENLLPLYRQVPESNSNLKATLLILLANICFAFNKYVADEWRAVCEMDAWFRQLQEVESSSLVQEALDLARARLPKLLKKRKKPKEDPAPNKDTNNTCPEEEQEESTKISDSESVISNLGEHRDNGDCEQEGQSVQNDVNETLVNLVDKEAMSNKLNAHASSSSFNERLLLSSESESQDFSDIEF